MASKSKGKPAGKAGRRTPTTQRLIDLLRRSREPLDTATIAACLSMHPNGVRLQLRRLEGRGLVERQSSREGIGRPRDLWLLSPSAIAEANRPHTGWAMARSLARAIPPTAARLHEVEEAGEQMGAELAVQLGPLASAEPREALSVALEALGFDPERTESGEVVRYRLMTCPYAEAVRENPKVVCTLHKGVIKGLLASVSPSMELSAFEPRDPDEAGCLVEISRRTA
ncbi:MAG: hypothetical protein U0R52_07425 [Solirubrobacterales bacterium]